MADKLELQRQAWLLSSNENQRFGSEVWRDTDEYYIYDNEVPNSKKLNEGDIVFIRDKETQCILKIAEIAKVKARKGTKIVSICKKCGTRSPRERTSKKPKYICDDCKFETEKKETKKIEVTKYKAHYAGVEETSIPLAIEELREKRLVPQYNQNNSIQRIEMKLMDALIKRKATDKSTGDY